MTVRVCSRPLPHLIALTFIALSGFTSPTTGAGLKFNDASVPAKNLDEQFVFALLTPMSRLVQSPYADPRALDNPLGLTVQSPTTVEAQTAINRPIPTTSARQHIDTLKVDAENPVTKISMAPPEPAEDTLSALNTTLSKTVPTSSNSAFAMTGL